MADVEKSEQIGMTGEENPDQINEGGEIRSNTPIDKEENKVSQDDNLSADLETETKIYSEEEYQHFVELYERTLHDISEGQIVPGRVLAVTDKEVLVDIGFKAEGTILLEEFEDIPDVKVGDKVEVYLDTIEDADGQLVLSKRKADFIKMWDRVVDIYNKGGTIEGVCGRRIKGGIVVDLMGVDAFLPGSQIDVKPVRDFDALIGQTFTFKIVKVNKLRKNIVVSRRALLEESMAEERKKILTELGKGQVREGTVKNITDFGVFVDLGGVDGLLHINDISWGRINHPSEVVKLDEKIKVVILDFNDAKDRISLGLKQLHPHPWDGVEERYPEEAVVKGKVVSIADYGAFVELEKGIEGLIHVSEMSWIRHTVHPSKMVNVGEVIEVKVLNIDKEKKRISLGLKQLTPDPWENIEEKYKIGSRFKGRVRNMTNFGVFVEMEEGVDGLIHISDLSWTRKIKHPSEILKRGNEIDVVVLDVDKKERRLSLGYKQLTDDPWPAFEEAYKVEKVAKGKVIRFIEKGLIVELPLGVEGFVPLSQLVESSMVKVAQSIKEGDVLSFVVIEFDRGNKRIVLSRKKAIELEEKGKKEVEKGEIESFIEKQAEGPTLAEVAGDFIEDTNKKAKKKKEVTSKKDEVGSKQEEKKEDVKTDKKETIDKKSKESSAKKIEKKEENKENKKVKDKEKINKEGGKGESADESEAASKKK